MSVNYNYSSFAEDDKLIYDFFLGLAVDSSGRKFDDILNFSENDIEEIHDFIQWIFPTAEKSRYNSMAPIISTEFKRLFLENQTAQNNFCKSCRMFLKFIAMDCNKEKGMIVAIDDKDEFYNLPKHNLLRITRVLNSLNQIGRSDCSKKIFMQLKKIRNNNPQKVSELSFKIWEETQFTGDNY